MTEGAAQMGGSGWRAGSPPAPIEAVAAVIERDGKFLITKRLETSPMGHCWEFPGGKVEAGEARKL